MSKRHATKGTVYESRIMSSVLFQRRILWLTFANHLRLSLTHRTDVPVIATRLLASFHLDDRMASLKDVAAKNQELFDRYKEKFSTVKHYIPAARKLGKWWSIPRLRRCPISTIFVTRLSSDKAYYPDARPQIVDIFLGAKETLSTATMTTHYGSLANAWIDLIFSVAPFQDRFVEPELQDSIRHLLETAARMKHPSSTAAPQDLVPPPPAPPT
ncbi:hypothetical protein C8R47DRAFT_490788 [Mycena vitilis]|nr:hypothetical protein C8R47DRAFT_490788 [Mycena vitilis]